MTLFFWPEHNNLEKVKVEENEKFIKIVHFCWGLEQDKKQEKNWAVHELDNRMQPYEREWEHFAKWY